MEQPNPYPSAGEIIDGKYKIEKMLGEGGMGAVARATHVVLGGTLALKFMNPQFMSFPGAVERFVNEGRASKAIKSDHVLPVNEIGLLPNGAPYLCMECLYGVDLADLLARDGPSGLPIERAIHFTVQILRGLQAAHAINIIHRDMKPSNCFVVSHDGEDDWVKILDFGISKIQQPGSSSLTQTNSALGTPLYMSPEQARSPRDVDHRSDIYSVGVILYELLCGRTPFFSESGEFTEILFQLFTADPPPLRETRPDIPEALAVVVHKALAREVADRYSSATELAEALEPFAAPKTLGMIERMRNFKAPTQQSIAPGGYDGPATAMDALSQLRHGTEHMPSRPRADKTEVPKSGNDTAIIESKPLGPAQKKTAVLESNPASALGKAKTQYDPNVARPNPAVVTDGGQAVDQPAPEPEQKRSPMIFVLPAVAAAAIGALAVVMVMKNGDKPVTTAPSAGPPSAVITAPTTPPPPVSVAETPSAKATETASAAVSVATPVPKVPSSKPVPAPGPAPSPKPVGDPGLAPTIKF